MLRVNESILDALLNESFGLIFFDFFKEWTLDEALRLTAGTLNVVESPMVGSVIFGPVHVRKYRKTNRSSLCID
jgi:hypothetical protein